MLKSRASIGMFSSEGGQFLGGYAMKEENKIISSAGLSSIWDNGSATRIRSIDGATIVEGRRLSMHLMIQPRVIKKLLHDETIQDQGLLSRILITAPGSNIGKMSCKRTAKKESTEYINNFNQTVEEIIKISLSVDSNNELTPRIINLSCEAKSILEDFSDYVTGRCGVDGEYEHIKKFINKYPEYAARLAATFALIEDINVTEIKEKYMLNAKNIMLYYINEILRLIGGGKVSNDILVAEKLAYWLKKKWEKEYGQYVSLPDIYMSNRYINSREHAEKIVAILEKYKYLEKYPGPKEIREKMRQEVFKIV